MVPTTDQRDERSGWFFESLLTELAIMFSSDHGSRCSGACRVAGSFF
jgi:hypothetical protein